MTTPLDADERRRRELASTVKRLRVAAMSDPARADELADALVQFTGSRLLAWAFAEAAADAPESVLLAARILAQRGPAGPYASLTDAVRYFTASAQLAAVQAGLGHAEAAGRTLDTLDGWRSQLGRLPLLANLDPAAATWALVARSRTLLVADVPRANAYADAALARLYAEGLEQDADLAYLTVAVHLAVADGRWAAGRERSALAHHRLALVRHVAVVGTTERPRPAVAQAALAPVAAVYEPFALRLDAAGESVEALAVRRSALALVERLGEAGAASAVAARAALGHALARAGRTDEAAAELAEAGRLAGAAPPAEIPLPALGEPVDWSALSAAEALRAQDPPADTMDRIEQDEQLAVYEGVARRVKAEHAERHLQAEFARAAAERAAERAAAEQRAAAEAAAAREATAARQRQEAAAARARRAEEEAAARAAAEDRRRQLAEARGRGREIDPDAVHAAEVELDGARADVRAAGSDLVPQAVARERLADLLRPLASARPETYGSEFVATLEALVGLRWRLGDPEGSREAAREAKALAGEFGR